MDSDAIDASGLRSVYQPLDVLRLELQNEPAFTESDMPKDDHTLTRFLKARGYNASQAKQMILDCIHWRRTVEDVGIEELYRLIDPFDFPGREGVFGSWPMGFHKTDKLGRPIHIQSFGAISAKRLYQQITPQDHCRTVLVNIEALLAEVLPAASAAAGRPIRQALVIVDLKGFGLSQFWAFKSIARRFFDVSQNYFPETMGQLIIINAPTSFTAIWGMIKPWLAPRTLDKITILGANHANQHTALLLDLVSPENLPTALGGTCTCTCTCPCAYTATTSEAVTASTTCECDSSSSDGDADSTSSSAAAAAGCALSNAGPWMDGRAERRMRWLRGEIAAPGVPWPPHQQQQQQARQKHEKLENEAEKGHDHDAAVTREKAQDEDEEEGEEEEEEEEACHQASAAVAGTVSAATATPVAPSPSPAPYGRASVVGLPLPLPHPPPPAAVRLVV
ncbi:CRAL-TRIO domain-containing protein [Russula dissimulans]|nr:CRAL-TRIO domain-containing protein [Russula dissimulans]